MKSKEINIAIYVAVLLISAYLVYSFPRIALDQIIAPVIFWLFLVLALLRLLNFQVRETINYPSRKKWYILLPYMALHYFAYGAILEVILVSLSGIFFPYLAVSGVSYIPFGNSSLLQTLLSLLFNPTISIIIPPGITLDLSPYSLSLGFLISILVTYSILTISDMSKGARAKVEMLAIALVGIVVGAGCCVSIPIIVAEEIGAIAAYGLALGSRYWEIAFAVYTLLPIITVGGLIHFTKRLSLIK